MHFRRLYLALLTLLLIALPISAQAQTTWTEWETIRPEGEEFTVTMPKNPTTETAKFPYHKMELNTRLYLAKSGTGLVLAIASFSGIKTNMGTEFERFNSYIDAFKDFFPPKVRTKDTALTKLTLISSTPFHGHTGRSYKLSIGDLNGVVHAFATRKRFYAIVSLNTRKDEVLEEKFLSSFELPDRQPDQPKAAASAANENEATLNANEQQSEQKPNPRRLPQGEGDMQKVEENADPNAANPVVANQPQNPNQPQPNAKRGPISGGALNGKAIYLPMPEVPPGEASGVVVVAVVIDETGTVIEARAISGPPNLHAAAVSAARLARFTPTLLMGEPVRVSGTLSYNFVRSN